MKNELNIIVMGPAGTGKSYMINVLNKQFKITLTSSTGPSACNIDGCTTDNLLHLHGNKINLLDYNKKKLRNRFKKIMIFKLLYLLLLMKFLCLMVKKIRSDHYKKVNSLINLERRILI